MNSLNQNKNYNPSCVTILSPQSRDVRDIQLNVKGTMVNDSFKFDQKWQLQKVYNIDNQKFNREFNDKKCELKDRSSNAGQWEVRYGFLSTIKESMVHKVSEEGIEVRVCPYNFFGHSVSGVHISQNADICMDEASTKTGPDDEIVLIVFKYMLGKHKIVPMYDLTVLLAPTPSFDSHLCEQRPDPIENISDQYIKSLVYLYEFENANLDPTVRPRHCCPIAALKFRRARGFDLVDLTVDQTLPSTNSVQDKSPFPFLNPTLKPEWGRSFVLPAMSTKGSLILIKKDARDDSRKVVVSDDDAFHPLRRIMDAQIWEPIRHGLEEPSLRARHGGIMSSTDSHDRSVISRIGPKRNPRDPFSDQAMFGQFETTDSMRVDRDRSPDLLKKWRVRTDRALEGRRGGLFDLGNGTTRNWFR